MTTPTNAAVERIEELLKKATPGPWKYDGLDVFDEHGEYEATIDDGNGELIILVPTGSFEPIKDGAWLIHAELVCLLRNSIKSLLAERKALRAALELWDKKMHEGKQGEYFKLLGVWDKSVRALGSGE